MAMDLAPITTTRAVRQLVALMEQEGLAPTYGPEGPTPYRGSVRICFDEGGNNGRFGVILIGARSGKVVRGEIHHGNTARPRLVNGYEKVRQTLLPR